MGFSLELKDFNEVFKKLKKQYKIYAPKCFKK